MKTLLSKTGYWRKDNLRVRTDVIKEGNKVYVKKTAIGSESKRILKNINKTYKLLSQLLPKTLRLVEPIKQGEDYATFEFCKGAVLEKEIENSLINRDFNKAKKLFIKGLEIIDSIKSFNPKKEEISKFESYFDLKNNQFKNEEFIYPPLVEITADHIFMDNNKFWLIDYEVFFDFPIPKEFVKFRYVFYLLHNMQNILQSITSEKFPLKKYLKHIFIPVDWDLVFKIPLNKIKVFLKMEEKLQSYMNWLEPRYIQFSDYKPKLATAPVREYLTKGKVISVDSGTHEELLKLQKDLDEYKVMMNRITSAKFFKLWQLYCNIRDKYIKRYLKKTKNEK